jgi:predicted AAA+ superfamily ATPase
MAGSGLDLSGFNLRGVGLGQLAPLWVRGGFPRSFLAADEAASMAWRNDFIRTFLEMVAAEITKRSFYKSVTF